MSGTTQAALADRLAERTLALVDIPSVSREEAAALAWIRTAIPSEAFEVLDEEDPVLFLGPKVRRVDAPFVVLAGHVDTVPPAGAMRARRPGADRRGGSRVRRHEVRARRDARGGRPPRA